MRKEDVKSVSDLAKFVADLNREIREARDGHSLTMFLNSMEAWLHDAGEQMLPDSVRKNPEVCREVAEILFMARHYD
jgi:hypothetical protein